MLLVCEARELVALGDMLRQPMSSGPVTLHTACDSASALALFAEHRPEVMVIAASLLRGDTAALIDSVRRMVGRAQVSVVVLGDEAGPITTALDAAELGGDRFVARPLSPKALRYAVAVSIDAARLARRGRTSRASLAVESHELEGGLERSVRRSRPSQPPTALRSEQRARWARLADSIASAELPEGDAGEAAEVSDGSEASASSLAGDALEQAEPLPPLLIQPRRTAVPEAEALAPPPVTTSPLGDDATWSSPDLLAQLPDIEEIAGPAVAPAPPIVRAPGGREVARQLRQKMSELAQRLFSHQDPAQLEAAPRHDHQIEFDLAALVEEPVMPDAADEVAAARTAAGHTPRDTSSGPTWDQAARDVRQRSIPDAGEILRGSCDAPAIVVRMWASAATGRVVFWRGEVEKIVFFDRGRPVFASSTELHDRMGELLYREGKITHSQYMHSKSLVAESGRRMGEILVDLGYLKRRELYPAVRRHVEDIIYSVFAWDHGSYRIALEDVATSERIRLSRHPEALVVEGIRRKLDRHVLERLVGPPSTVLELTDRERVLGLATTIELTADERAAIAAIDGQADLPAVARAAGTSIGALFPLAWALVVLGYAVARREGGEVVDNGDELVAPAESDLAIDRERVRARWLLVADADYFALLGVRRDATSFEIRRAYEASRRDFAAEGFPVELRRELARELDDISTVLDEAFRVLRDDSLRRQYLAHLVD